MRRSSLWISVAITTLLVTGSALLRYTSGGKATLVEDDLGLFTPKQLARISEHHAFLLKDHAIDYRVVTRSTGGDINGFAVRYFDDNRVGSESPHGHGLLLVIDPEQDMVRLEVSRSLEGTFVDAFVAYIEQRQMAPFFAKNRIADGVLATTEMIVTRVQNAKANAGFSTESWAAATSGAGATSKAGINRGGDDTFRQGSDHQAAGSPLATLERYQAAMAQRNLRPDLDIYSAGTKAMLKGWVMTAAQADNQAKSLQQCDPVGVQFSDDMELAVIRYPIRERTCNPWFMVFEDGAWRLDLTMMQKAIRFGRSNAWHFASGVRHPYQFAFADWEFDQNGFPVRSHSH
ncbi:MAG: TPM domain-containing protein [Thiobacillaceae bacterium]|jgi:uncharacterized protein|nr:TPM domain-containing protein [Thiobacillaceae bacterium]